MAVSTAIPAAGQAIHRGASSTDASTVVSPTDSPRPSSSSTSLSSMNTDSDVAKSTSSGMVDTYGNPFELPDFTVDQLRKAIPAHCFNRSTLISLSYVLRDFILIGLNFTLFYTFNTPEYVASKPIRALLWALYTFVQGLFGTGVWVLAHECGHQAFSPSTILNDTVGWVCHSALLVPYFSWKISHGMHHRSTGHLGKDMVFVPRTRDQHLTRIGKLAHEFSELVEETPIASAFDLVVQQLFGWPIYLITNITGHNFHKQNRPSKGEGKENGWFGGVNHFNPSSPLYSQEDEKYILLSDLGLGIAGTVLYLLGNKFGWANMAVWYFIPYLWVNHWLVAITYLQHTDPQLPHYTDAAWTYARGAGATIDREFGFIGRQLLHGIVETHVLHHYFHTIPFYRADEASEAIKKVMGKHYRSDTEGGSLGFLAALWKSRRWCQWVEPCTGSEGINSGVMFFRNTNGLGVPPAELSVKSQ